MSWKEPQILKAETNRTERRKHPAFSRTTIEMMGRGDRAALGANPPSSRAHILSVHRDLLQDGQTPLQFKRIKVMQSSFYSCSGMKLEIYNRRKTRKSTRRLTELTCGHRWSDVEALVEVVMEISLWELREQEDAQVPGPDTSMDEARA